MLLLCMRSFAPSFFESIQNLLSSAYKGLFLVYLKALRFLYIRSFSIILEKSLCIHLMSIPTHGYCGRYNGSCRGISGLLEQAIITVFSLHLGEPLVLDLAMLTFISLPYTVLHHNFQFLCLISFSEFRSEW
jgi:hypothetical protein